MDNLGKIVSESFIYASSVVIFIFSSPCTCLLKAENVATMSKPPKKIRTQCTKH